MRSSMPSEMLRIAPRNRYVMSFERSLTRSPTTTLQRAPGPRRCSSRVLGLLELLQTFRGGVRVLEHSLLLREPGAHEPR